MRKTRLIIIISLALTACCMICGFIFLKNSEKLTGSFETLYGDASAADGLEIDGVCVTDPAYSEIAKNIWKLSYKISGEDMTLDSEAVYESEGGTSEYFYFSMPDCLENIETTTRDTVVEKCSNILREAKKKDSSTEGVTVKLTDLFEYLPLSFCISIGDYYTWYNMYDAETVRADYEKLIDFFKIPIPETMTVDFYSDSVTATSEEAATSYYFSYANAGNDFEYYKCKFNSVLSSNYIFIYTFSDVDFSLIPGGRGIYRLPYVLSDKKSKYGDNPNTRLLTEDLTNFYPLSDDVTLVTIRYNESSDSLLLFTWEDSRTYLTVIDAETGAEIQKTVVSDEMINPSFYIHDDSYILRCAGSRHIIILESNDDRTFSKVQDFVMDENTYNVAGFDDDCYYLKDIAYKDGKIAFLGSESETVTHYWAPAGSTDTYSRVKFRVAVINEGKLAFVGSFTNSLDDANYGHYIDLYFSDDNMRGENRPYITYSLHW